MARLRPNIVRAVVRPNGIRPGRTPFGPTSAVEILAKKTRIYGIALQGPHSGPAALLTGRASVDPAAQARQAEVRKHVAHGAELCRKGQYAEAEREYRAALLLDSQNADLHPDLTYIPGQEEKENDAEASREDLRLNPGIRQF